MNSLHLILVAGLVFDTFVVGHLLARYKEGRTFRAFLPFATAQLWWQLCSVVLNADIAAGHRTLILRLAMVGALPTAFLFYHFIIAIGQQHQSPSRFYHVWKWLVAAGVLLSLFTDLLVRGGEQFINGAFLQIGPAYVWAIPLLVLPPTIASLWNIVYSWRYEPDLSRRSQWIWIGLGLLASTGLALLFSTILPVLFGITKFLPYPSCVLTIHSAIFLMMVYRYDLLSSSINDAANLLLTHLTDGVLILNSDGFLVESNPAACRLLGLPRELLMGKRLDSVLPEAKGIKPGDERDLAVDFNLADDLPNIHRELLLTAANVRIGTYSPIGLLVWIRDLTTVKAANQEKEAAQARSLEHTTKSLIEAQRLGKMGSWTWHVKNQKFSCSDEVYNIFGIPMNDTGIAFDDVMEYVAAEDRQRVRASIGASLRTGNRHMVEYRIYDNGEMRHIHSIGAITRSADGKIKSYTGTLQDITEHRTTQLRLASLVHDNRRLTQTILTTQEEERRVLARELHDDAGQALTAIRLNLASMVNLTNNKTLHSRIDSATAMTDQLFAAIRNILNRARVTMIDELGLEGALRTLLEQWEMENGTSQNNKTTSIPVALEVDKNFVSPSHDIATALYRITQESLTNIQKYAGPCEVTITLNQDHSSHTLALTIDDDGKGFDLATATEGLGIVGIKERVQGLNGTCAIISELGQGTRIQLVIPIA